MLIYNIHNGHKTKDNAFFEAFGHRNKQKVVKHYHEKQGEMLL